jgi:Flp pilus assembly protein TadB
MVYKDPRIQDILKKYSARIESQINTSNASGGNYSNEYLKFKEELAPDLTKYERWCYGLGSFIKLQVSKKDQDEVSKHLQAAHLDVEPWQALTLAVMAFLGIFFIGLFGSLGVAIINGGGEGISGIATNFPFFFFILMLILALFVFYFVKAYPARLANKWRLKASSQMVPAILYVVVYMRHTPNLEKAVAFAAEHLQEPLSLDFKKVFYDVEIGKFPTIKDSLDNYLEGWRDYSTEFIEAFHLIESSLFELDNSRRIATLEKSLQVVLDGVYDKMLKFTHGVRSPLTNVYMLGVVLPTLGLALLPLASAMIGKTFTWHHVFIIFNLIVPFVVFYLTDKIMFLRPGGYGETTLLEKNPFYYQYKDNSHYFNAFLICLPFFIIGLLPLIFQFTPIPDVLGLEKDYTFSKLGLGFLGEDQKLFGFEVDEDGSTVGPFGIGALILGMFLPLGIALFFSIAYQDKTRIIIVEREKTKQLEDEFNNSLFQLGNRIGNGAPPELAFGMVAGSSKGLVTEEFFQRVNYNVKQMGMDVDKAIFDQKRGALIYFPSDLIATSMRVLIESAKKGLNIAATSLMSISQYVKNIQKITVRLKDMLAEIVSDMKSNMTFLAPLLAGIVVGLAAMITSILTTLEKLNVSGESIDIGFTSLPELVKFFEVNAMVPPYYLQIIVGIYLIQIIFILSRTLVTIDSGEDKLERVNKTGKNLQGGIVLYFFTALFATFALFLLTAFVLAGLTSGLILPFI